MSYEDDYPSDLEIHEGAKCQEVWRDLFSFQIEEALRIRWPEEEDANADRAYWFREGLTYAMMLIRFDKTEVDEHGLPRESE